MKLIHFLGRPPDQAMVVLANLPISEGMKYCLQCQVCAVGNKMLNIILFWTDLFEWVQQQSTGIEDNNQREEKQGSLDGDGQ